MKVWITLIAMMLLALCGMNLQAQEVAAPAAPDALDGVTPMVKAVCRSGRFAYVLVHDSKLTNLAKDTAAMKAATETFLKTKPNKGQMVELDRSAPAAQTMVAKYSLAQAPMPLLLVVAPNGAITGGFPQRVNQTQLASTIVSKGMMAMMKYLQAGEMVILKVRGTSTAMNAEADAGVQAFVGQLTATPPSVTVDPADPEEATFLQQIQVDPKTKQAITMLLAPPGSIIGRFDGAVTGAQMVAALQSAFSCQDTSCGDKSCEMPVKTKGTEGASAP